MNHKIISTASVPSRTESRTGQRGITETGLKWIALVSMLMDHIYYFFGYTNLIPWWFGLAGRLAAPLFLFCLVEGFFHTGSRKRYFLKMLCIAAPMGLLHFFMRFGNVFVRPDGFYPQNAMLSSFLILIVCFQAFEWIGSRRLKKVAAGCGVLLALLAWPFVAGILSGGLYFPIPVRQIQHDARHQNRDGHVPGNIDYRQKGIAENPDGCGDDGGGAA